MLDLQLGRNDGGDIRSHPDFPLEFAQPTAGTAYEMDAIAAVVLGGTSLAGGKGRIFGTLVGALIIGTLNNGLNLLGVSSFYQQVVKGIVILIAVLIDRKKS